MAVIRYFHFPGKTGSSGNITEPETAHGHAVIVLNHTKRDLKMYSDNTYEA